MIEAAFFGTLGRDAECKVAASGNGKVEIGGVWSEPAGGGDADGENHLQAGRFVIDVARRKAPLAMAAPGLR